MVTTGGWRRFSYRTPALYSPWRRCGGAERWAVSSSSTWRRRLLRADSGTESLTAREIIVSGDGISAAVGAPARQLVCVRRPASQEEQAQDNVIDLAAWKAAREEETRLEEEWYAGVDEALAEPAPIPPRPRRNHKKRVLLGGELLATLSVIGTMALLAARILA